MRSGKVAPPSRTLTRSEIEQFRKDWALPNNEAYSARIHALCDMALAQCSENAPDLLPACRKAVVALAHASEKMSQYRDDYQALSDAIDAHVQGSAVQTSAQTEGWKLVPLELTDDMRRQAFLGRAKIEAAALYRALLDAAPSAPRSMGTPPEDYKALYHELLFAVGNKHPGESRHQTALRYIEQAEDIGQGSEAKNGSHG